MDGDELPHTGRGLRLVEQAPITAGRNSEPLRTGGKNELTQ